MIFFPLVPIAKRSPSFSLSPLKCLTMGLISDSFSFVRRFVAFFPSIPLKALFDVRIYLLANTPGRVFGLREMRKNFHLFILKLKIKFQRFLLPFFLPLEIAMWNAPSPSTLDDVKWRQKAEFLWINIASLKLNRVTDKMSKWKYFPIFQSGRQFRDTECVLHDKSGSREGELYMGRDGGI